ncbi:MAG: enoyl-CoA hydratase/isomerase family protein [Pseudonocardiales bacterium]|nr:enoyl-CoA hydratase/isomerase family protein [Pseudonocardiales bacterium]
MKESELVRVERRTEHDNAVTVVRMCEGENRFRPDSLAAIAAALDEVEGHEAPGAVVFTGAGKFFSNGLDLDWMGSAPPGGSEGVLAGVHALLARVLAFPTVTVAAINGHAYAGGAMLALACDFRVMRADRGYLCLPEADLGLPFTHGMTMMLRARMSPTTATAAMVFGARYGGAEAVTAGLVNDAVAESEVLAAALRRAGALAGKDGATVRTIKERLYAEPLAALRAEAP